MANMPSPVEHYHTDTYPAIDPTAPQNSTKGKNVVITGGGGGIGRETALSFAKSGSSSISLLGRTEKTLLETKALIEKDYSSSKVFTYVADISDKDALVKALTAIKEAVGPVDVLVANAGYLPDVAKLGDTDLSDWYTGFDVNVKGNYNLLTAFFPVAAKGASIIHISTGMTHFSHVPGHSGYHTSKLAAVKLFDYVHFEYPDLFVVNVHPGVFATDMGQKSMKSGASFPLDQSKLKSPF